MQDVRIVPMPLARMAEARALVASSLECDLAATSYMETRLRLSDKFHFHVYGALRGDALVGVSGFELTRESKGGLPVCKLHNLAVAAGERGKGIGRALALHAEEIATVECLGGNPGVMILWDITEFIPRDDGFYGKLGYRENHGETHNKIKNLGLRRAL